MTPSNQMISSVLKEKVDRQIDRQTKQIDKQIDRDRDRDLVKANLAFTMYLIRKLRQDIEFINQIHVHPHCKQVVPIKIRLNHISFLDGYTRLLRVVWRTFSLCFYAFIC